MTMLPKMRRATDKNLSLAASGVAGLQKEIIALRTEIVRLSGELADEKMEHDLLKDMLSKPGTRKRKAPARQTNPSPTSSKE